jgi:glycosyltransferase involved in cell wall biosynthesis
MRKVLTVARVFAPITLVLTVHNSASELPELLAGIGRLRVLPSELSITDLGSTDGTVEMIRAWQPPGGIPVRVITSPGASIAVGRNLAIESSSFEHIAITDGAVCLDPEWLARMWAALSEGNDVIAGKIQPVGSTVLERTIAGIQTPDAGEMESAWVLPSSRSIAFAKTQWDAVGGYPEWLRHGQDDAFIRALRSAGSAVRFVPGALSSWNPRQSLVGYLQACFNVSRAEGAAGLIGSGPMLRLAAYGCGLVAVVLFPRSTPCKFAATAAWVAHLGPQPRRVWRSRSDSPDGLAVRALATLAIVLGADAAWFTGYPLGLLEGWNSQAHAQERHRDDSGVPSGSAAASLSRPAAGRHRVCPSDPRFEPEI